MWREYTRETPAKPGWAIASAGAALALTTGLAWVLAHQGVSASTLGGSVSPPFWPISLSLPPEAKPLTNWNNESLGSDPAGNAGVAAFSWDTPDSTHPTTIVLAYKVLIDDDDSRRISSRGFGDGFDEADEITVGPMSGRSFVAMTPAGSRVYSALAKLDEDLAVRIDMICPPGLRNSEGLFRRICRSVAFRDWYVSDDAQYWIKYSQRFDAD